MKSRNLAGGVLGLLLLACVSVASSGKSGPAAAVDDITRLINQDVSTSLAGDTSFVKATYVDGYIEGSSFGTWITKSDFLDTSTNSLKSRNISELKVDVFGDTAIARFRQSYEAIVQGQPRSRTVICTQTWNNQKTWKLLATHCSQSQ